MEHFEKLTKQLAEKEIQEIIDCSGDNEYAHIKEDCLMGWFINCVSKGVYEKEEAIEVAKVVQQASDIEFTRWFA